jgi:hypothetical protein
MMEGVSGNDKERETHRENERNTWRESPLKMFGVKAPSTPVLFFAILIF